MINDEKIKNVMNSLKTDLPHRLDAELDEMIRTEAHSPSSWKVKVISLLKWSPAAAAALFLLLLGLSEWKRPVPEDHPIRELRIQYELKEKNIKILWLKKDGFSLERREK